MFLANSQQTQSEIFIANRDLDATNRTILAKSGSAIPLAKLSREVRKDEQQKDVHFNDGLGNNM